jgi:hypothetical protein
MSKFTMEDANNLIAHAQTAPLQNMRVANYVSDLLARFQEFAIETLLPKPATVQPKAARPVNGSQPVEADTGA